MSRAAILMYHILDAPRARREARYCCLPARFAEQMAWIGANWHTLGLNELLAGLQGQTALPENAVAVTFDDGFACTFEHAMRVLGKYRIPATMFIVASRIGGDNDWVHSPCMPKRPLMDTGQIREMHAAGIDIGSHTLNHAQLPETLPEQTLREIGGSKSALEDLLSASVRHFAYPYGLYNATVRDLVEQAGYASACSTRPGFNNWNTDRFLLRRIEVFGSDRLWQFKQKLTFGTNRVFTTDLARYYLGRTRKRMARVLHA